MEDIIFGRNPVKELLQTDQSINKLLVLETSKDKSVQKIIEEAKSKRLVIQFVDRKKLDQLTEGQNHQGVLAYVAPFAYAEISEMFALAEEKGEDPFFIICDEITDPHNLGSLIRTADAVGAHGVIIPKRRGASVNATVVKTSCGAAAYVKVARVTNLSQTIQSLKDQGVWICGTSMEAPVYHQVDLKGSIAVIIGNEGRGMSPALKKHSDLMVSMPMKGQVDSLNASVAGAIVMYEILRQRTL